MDAARAALFGSACNGDETQQNESQGGQVVVGSRGCGCGCAVVCDASTSEHRRGRNSVSPKVGTKNGVRKRRRQLVGSQSTTRARVALLQDPTRSMSGGCGVGAGAASAMLPLKRRTERCLGRYLPRQTSTRVRNHNLASRLSLVPGMSERSERSQMFQTHSVGLVAGVTP